MERENTSQPGDGSSERITDRAARGAHDTIDRVAEHARTAEDRLRESASEASVKARATADQARERGREYSADIQNFVLERPLLALGIAFAAGCLISRMGRH